jgi:hypothetical protein
LALVERESVTGWKRAAAAATTGARAVFNWSPAENKVGATLEETLAGNRWFRKLWVWKRAILNVRAVA